MMKNLNQKNDWNDLFVHVDNKAESAYLTAISHTANELSAMFGEVSAPYSGLYPEQLKAQITALPIGKNPIAPLADIISDSIAVIGKNSIIVQHPHCIAHLHTPPLIPALAAETIISALNQSMDSWDQASSATYVEQKMTDWLCELFGYNIDNRIENSVDNCIDSNSIDSRIVNNGVLADGVFTSGGTQSNLMGLLLARDRSVEAISGESVQKDGLPYYAKKLRILCSETSHFTVQKSASLMGLGERAVVTVPVDTLGRLDITALELCIADLQAQDLIPFCVVGTAGTTDLGAIDDLQAIANIAKQHKMWFHVDGAYGGALILSSHKDRLTGIELADSISTDFHKLFFQPISCGALLIRDSSNFKYLLHHADYLNRETDELPNLVDKSIATTKRFDALKLLMSMQALGTDKFGAMYDHLISLTLQVAELVAATADFELLAQPQLSTVLFRFNHKQDADLNMINQRLRLDLLTAGQAVLGETKLQGSICLKLTILNPCLQLSDFDGLFTKIAKFARQQSYVS
jgi:L-2,4-diaminobutyrate decarboxylase